MMPPIAGFIPSTMIEWEDRLSAALVLQGCNFRCPFCHSALYVPVEPPAEPIEWERAAEALEQNRDWLDGVVVSGGEPTIHAGLAELLSALRSLELPVKLDTNGSAPSRLAELVDAGLVAHVALDVKAPLDEESYAAASGRNGSLEGVRESLRYLRLGGISYELRTTVYPAVFTDETKLLDLARELVWADRWYLQGFRPVGCLDPEAARLPATDEAWLDGVAERCNAIAPGCRVRRSGG
jgi:pyruvate formate lyase activating enzyme